MNLAVVTCFFNFAGFKRPQANLHRFLRQMKRDGAEVFGVELSTNGRFATLDIPNWRQIVIDPERQTLFQKEAALNLVFKTLDPKYDAVAWFDSDIWFSNPHWLEEIKVSLKTWDIIQPFSTCEWVDAVGQVILTKPSVKRVPFSRTWSSHPGFAWAARRELLVKAVGLYPYVITGGGDAFAALAFQGTDYWPELGLRLGRNDRLLKEWASKVRDTRLGYVAGEVFHEWHGDLRNRSYNRDLGFLKDFDVERDLEFDKHGLLRWTDRAPDTIIRAVADQFFQRNEDG